jgi:hypothetical protein
MPKTRTKLPVFEVFAPPHPHTKKNKEPGCKKDFLPIIFEMNLEVIILEYFECPINCAKCGPTN